MAMVRGGESGFLKRLSLAPRLICIVFTVTMMLGGCGSADTSGTTSAASTDVELQLASSALGDIRGANPPDADARRGLQIVMGMEPCARANRCFACITCHGIRGQGSALARQPRLAGQVYQYLYLSLRGFASGRRENPTMHAVATGLTEQQMRDVAAYYAAMPPDQLEVVKEIAAESAQTSQTSQTAQAIAQGRTLAAKGSASQSIQPCAICHGSNGEGLPSLGYPALANQYPAYLEQQLQAFKAGTRRGEEALLMTPVAERLSGEQMHAAALYYGYIPSKETPSP